MTDTAARSELRTEPFDSAEARLLHALFQGDGATAVAQFAGEPNLDANVVGRVTGAEAMAALAQRWAGVFGLEGPVTVVYRDRSAAGSRSFTEAQVEVAGPDGPVVLPIGIMGLFADDSRSGGIERAHVYFYEKPVNGSDAVRVSSYELEGTERLISSAELSGANQRYLAAVEALDLEGVLATFSDDATVEIGTSVIRTDQIPRLYQQFISEEVKLFFSSQIDDGRGLVVEWASGHLDPQASGVGIYVYDGNGGLRSIRMYDHFDPSLVPGLELEPIRLGAEQGQQR